MQDGNYVSVKMFGSIGRIEEGLTRDEIHSNARSRSQGFETDEPEERKEAPFSS